MKRILLKRLAPALGPVATLAVLAVSLAAAALCLARPAHAEDLGLCAHAAWAMRAAGGCGEMHAVDSIPENRPCTCVPSSPSHCR